MLLIISNFSTKMKKSKIIYFLLGFFLAFPTISKALIKLPAIFSDQMVLQQKAKVQLWGWASPGEEICLIAQWQKQEIKTKADQLGNWKLVLQTPIAGGSYTIKIKGKNLIVLKDVLIGEVWFCSGQSNMAFPLKYSDSAKEEIAKANYPAIRYFSIKKQYGQQPFKDSGGSVWEKASPETAPSFSAVAYYFAKKINNDLKVPVGIVYSAWGGTPAEAWTPKKILEKDSSFQFYLRRWKEIPGQVGKDSMDYHQALLEWEKNSNSPGNTLLPKLDLPRTLYYYQRPWCQPAALFNGMINPVIPYTFKGILWYQGESNVGEAENYEHLFTSMISSWRNQWSLEGGEKVLPFYFVQIAPFGYSNLDAAARLRDAQYQVMKKVKNTGMAVTIDLGNMSNIHFTHKKEVGERLALIGLAKSYGFNGIIFHGPSCKSVIKVNKGIHLTFDQPLFTIHQRKPKGFEIGYKNPVNDSMIFVQAQSKITENQVIVWSAGVEEPLVVRYAWLEAGEANLINKNSLPAFPFEKKILLNKSEQINK